MTILMRMMKQKLLSEICFRMAKLLNLRMRKSDGQ